MPEAESRGRWSLVTALTWGASSAIAVALLVVLGLSLRAGTRSAEDLLTEWAVSVVTSVTDRLAEHVEPARSQAVQLAELIGAQDFDDSTLGDLLGISLAAAPQLSATIFVGVDGRHSGVARQHDTGALHRILHRPSGNLVADLLHTAQQMARAGTRTGTWGEVTRLPRRPDATIRYRQPVWRGERLLGILVTTVRTSHLADYLDGITATNGAEAFVLLGENELVAASSVRMRELYARGEDTLPVLAEVPDPALRAMWNPIDRVLNAGMPRVPGFQVHVQRTDTGEEIGYVTQYVYDIGPTPWLVGCYFRIEQLQEAMWRIRGAGIAGLVVLLTAAAATFWAGRSLGRPILRLAGAAQSVQSGGPGAAPPLPPSPLREVDTASRAFNEMVAGLRERERLRETFGRYVPESIADELIALDGMLRPQTRDCTTLFTDIVGFSTVSEKLSPEDLIGMLNEYFAVVVGPIEGHGGVIHQFQGDAILATYNLPVADDDHAAQAIRSALEIQDATRGRTFGPGVELATRVGINTGPAVCGTVGAASRLGFTVHGDDVNLAARIEQMNKSIGTRVLVAESTVRLAGAGFEFTEIGELPVRGRAQSVRVFRVAGPHAADETVDGG